MDEWPERASPAEHAVELAELRIWTDPERVFITTVPELEEEGADDLGLPVESAHALVFALSRLPEASRVRFAERFYERRVSARREPAPTRLAAAAAIALLVADLTGRDDVRDPRVLDLLEGAAQGDDPSLTPEPALADVRKVVVCARLDLGFGDRLSVESAATTAVLEVLDPSSDEVALQEILLRATWAALRSWEPDRVLEFLVAADELIGG